MMRLKQIGMSLLFISVILGGDRIAIVTKVIGSVNYTRGNDASKSLKTLIFIDDKSALKIKENSELIISGKRTARAIAKEINLDSGTIRAQVGKQKRGDFVIRTSVSVASVKGTDFWLISDQKVGDSVIGLEGIVSLLNQISGETLDVTSGFTGLSSMDGSLQSFKTDPKTIPVDPIGSAGDSKKLIIEFEDASGKKKTLIIDYK